MKRNVLLCAGVVLLLAAVHSQADTFGTGNNQFTIDFVTISGATNPSSGYGIVDGDYRIGTYEITNAQWAAFEAETGLRFTASYRTGNDIPVTRKNWYAAAQFVNWLNTSSGHQAAYNIDAQGNFAVWGSSAAAGGTNLYRHKDAFYFLPTEDEWVKAAYWNGMAIQTYATKPGESLHPGNAAIGTGWNYYDYTYGHAVHPVGPWAIGSGSEELNGTYDMMGNVLEWVENSWFPGNYPSGSERVLLGGCCDDTDLFLSSAWRSLHEPYFEGAYTGFRIASVIPEPATVFLLGLGGMALRRRGRR